MSSVKNSLSHIQLGLKENWAQFLLLVIINAFVGAMVGLERSILPEMGEEEFGIAARTAILSFIVVFGLTKAAANYFAGRLSDRWTRKSVLVAGWLVAIPVPFLLMWAPGWGWVLFANVLLGASQGLSWSAAVIMKIDLAGPRQRGLAMGFNEAAGYFAVGGAALATGWIAANYGLRPEPFYLGVAFVVIGLFLSVFIARDTSDHARLESQEHSEQIEQSEDVGQKEVFAMSTWRHADLSSVSQAGLVTNLKDGMAWGLFPLFYAAAGMDLAQIGILTAIYPALWGVGQLFTGGLSDRVGRKIMIVVGMWMQAAGIVVTVLSGEFVGFAVGAVLLGVGTALVYPTLLAAVSDVAHPSWRASAVGIYRLWRDSGYAVGAIVAGVIADALDMDWALWVIAAIAVVSGLIVAVRMKETLRPSRES